MKKRLLLLVLAALLVLTLAACGGSGNTATTPPQTEPPETETSEVDATQEEPGASATLLQDMLDEEGADMEADFNALLPALGFGEGSRVSVTANDANSELIFSFYFGDIEALEDADLTDYAETMATMLGPILQPLAEITRDELEMDSLTLTIALITQQGNEILRKSVEV